MIRHAFILLCFGLLVSCGGGSDGSISSTTPPTVPETPQRPHIIPGKMAPTESTEFMSSGKYRSFGGLSAFPVKNSGSDKYRMVNTSISITADMIDANIVTENL